MFRKNRYIVHENNTCCTKFASPNAKKYHQFCTMHGLKQLIISPTRVTYSTSTLIDHILSSFPSKVSNGKVFRHVSLKSKFTQKYFPNHGGIYIN